MYIYHALVNALSAHMIHINLNMIFYTHVEHSPTKTNVKDILKLGCPYSPWFDHSVSTFLNFFLVLIL